MSHEFTWPHAYLGRAANIVCREIIRVSCSCTGTIFIFCWGYTSHWSSIWPCGFFNDPPLTKRPKLSARVNLYPAPVFLICWTLIHSWQPTHLLSWSVSFSVVVWYCHVISFTRPSSPLFFPFKRENEARSLSLEGYGWFV